MLEPLDNTQSRKPCCSTTGLLTKMAFVDNLLSAFFQVTLSGATVITRCYDLPELIPGIGISLWGLVISGLTVGPLFSYCEAYAHDAINQHMNHMQALNPQERVDLEAQASQRPFHCGKKFIVAMHYGLDMISPFDNILPILEGSVANKYVELYWRILFYAAVLAWKAFVCWQELSNSATAIRLKPEKPKRAGFFERHCGPCCQKTGVVSSYEVLSGQSEVSLTVRGH